MRREIIISASSRETRVALLEDKRLVELMLDRPDQGRLVGDVFLGRVEAVLPGIQAAFVDIGFEKAGFLHVSDVVHEDGEPSRNGRDGKQRSIQKLLNKGDRVTVQVTKEPIGTKGPRLTAQVSLAGRFLVYMPFSSRVGVSRKIEDRRQRSRLRALARKVIPADSGGVIVRTVGEEATEKRFAREFESLRGSWLEIQRTAKAASGPGGRAPRSALDRRGHPGPVQRQVRLADGGFARHFRRDRGLRAERGARSARPVEALSVTGSRCSTSAASRRRSTAPSGARSGSSPAAIS